MDDFLILLQAKLDEAKSKGNINSDIDKIQGQIDKLKIQAEIDPKTISNLVKQLENVLNQKINISNIGINSSNAVKIAQQTGQQIGNAISQGMSSASKSTDKILRDFSELNDVKRQFVDNHDLISKDDIADAEKLYDTVRKAFSEFGQVTVSKGSMNDGSLENMRVKIEQVKGELKITRDVMLYFNERKNGFKLIDDDTIRTTEKMVQHLNEEKNIINVTNEEANAIKAKLAEQEKYYKNIKNEVNNLYSLKTKLLSADELQTIELEKQVKQTKERISYNNKQIDKKDLRDVSLDRQINDLEVAKQKQLALAEARTQDAANAKIQADAQKEVNAALKEQQSLQSQVNEIQLSIADKGNTTTQIKILTDNFTKLGLSSDEVKTKMSGVDKELVALQKLFNDCASDSAIISQFDKLELSLNETQNDLKATRSEYSLLVSDQQRLAKANVIEAWNLKNKNSTQDVRSANEAYIASLRDLNTEMTKVKFNDISDGFSRIKNQMTALGKISTAVKGQIAQASASLVSFVSLSGVVMRAVNTVAQMPSKVTALDTALVDLRKTANMSAQELEDFYYASNDVAKQMGVTTEEILNQASAWSRLGFNTAETATQMAKFSSQFALISPGLSIDDATSGLVSVMKAYDIEVSDVLDGIESKINIIGNNLALSNANIVKMLQDSVSTMAESRNTLEETIALESAAYEITQNENVGNGFKTMALRLRGMNEETEELDESLKNIKGDLYDLTGVSIMEDEHTYKSTYQILKETTGVWDSLTDKARAEALELMFGKLRSNIGAAVIKNFSAAEKAMDLMANSAGNADAELSVAMDSIEYKMNRLSETGTSVAQNLFQREDMKTVIDGLTSIAEVIDKVTEKLGLFGTIGAGVGIYEIFKNVDYLKTPVCPLYI